MGSTADTTIDLQQFLQHPLVAAAPTVAGLLECVALGQRRTPAL